MKNDHTLKTENVENAFSLMPKDEFSRFVLNERAGHIATHPKDEIIKNLDRYIKFRLGKEFYGIPYETTIEVMNDVTLTLLPNAPNYIAGIINRRGILLTIIDLKIFLKIPIIQEEKDKHVIVVKENGITVGILADNIEGDETYDKDLLDETLPSEINVQTQYITGIHNGITAITNIAAIIKEIQAQLSNIHAK